MSNRSLAIHHLQTAVLCAVMARCKINLHEPAGMVASWQHCPKFREVQIWSNMYWVDTGNGLAWIKHTFCSWLVCLFNCPHFSHQNLNQDSNSDSLAVRRQCAWASGVMPLSWQVAIAIPATWLVIFVGWTLHSHVPTPMIREHLHARKALWFKVYMWFASRDSQVLH